MMTEHIFNNSLTDIQNSLNTSEEEVFVFPTSFAQQRLWFLDQLEPGKPFYNLPSAVLLKGKVNIAVLEQSFNEIVRRHEALRSTFATVDNQPVQIIASALSLTLSVINLRGLSQTKKEAEVQKLVTEEARRPFDLAKGSLLRTTLLQLNEQEYMLLLTMHHIVSDGWSMGVLIRELAALYEEFSIGVPSKLPDLPIQYADFAVWQRENLQGEQLDTQLNYWKQQLNGAPPLLKLPTDRPRPRIQTFRGARQSFVLSKFLTDALKNLSRRENVTLFMVLLAAFKTLLYRYAGQTDILVGSPIANRNQAEIEGLIGFFVNTLILRTDLSGNPKFRELLAQIREVTLKAYEHQDLPFEKLVEELQPERSLSYNPLFQVMFVLQNAPMPALAIQELTLTPLEVDSGTCKFDLMVDLSEKPEGIAGFFEYNTDLFDATTISWMVSHFQTLLQGIVTDPDRHLENIPLLTPKEQHQLLLNWNNVHTPPSSDRCIHHLFEAQVERTPDAIAVIFENEHLTYRELNQRANQVAHYLQHLGVAPEVLVGLCVERSPLMVIGLLGILKAGGAYVPLDPAYPANRLAFTLEDSQVLVLLTQERLLETLPKHNATVLCLDIDWEAIQVHSQTPVKNPKSDLQDPSNLAYLIYTSGSTGKPKGVAIEHRNTVALLEWAEEVFTLEDIAGVLASTSLCFDLSVFELFVPLSRGGTLVLAENALYLPNLSAAERVTLINTVPSAIAELLRVQGIPASVRTVNLAGEPLQNTLLKQLYQQNYIQQAFNLYGPSEDTTYSTFALMKKGAEGIPPIGRPVANTKIYLLDRWLQPTPIGVPGEIYISGAGVARGYLNNPQLTADKFIPNPYNDQPNSRLYKTGDLARYLPDGNIEYLGRIDNQVKIRGFRIELEEIEVVLGEHPAVQKAVVLVREDEADNKHLVAYIVQNSNYQELDKPALKEEWNAERISHWQSLYEEIYNQSFPNEDLRFNIVGWKSSYTNLPMLVEEMREWVDRTVEHILALQPKRVLEIGCGTGLLLFRIASQCTQYWGTDFSQTAINYIQQQLNTTENKLPQVNLLQKEAADFEGIEPESFDLVILNSVVQYFPNIDYLLRVLSGAVNTLKSEGFIFIGDVRSLLLLEAFHTSVQLYQAPGSLSQKQLLQRIHKNIAQEQELVIDPAFFTALKQYIPRINHVQILPKRGRHHNELTKFRYDVILHVGSEVISPQDFPWLDWQKQKLTLTDICQLLEETKPDILGLRRVSNSRLQLEVKTLKMLASVSGYETVDKLREDLGKMVSEPGVDPEDLWNLNHKFPYSIDINWSSAERDGSYDVVFKRDTTVPSQAYKVGNLQPLAFVKPWNSYANNPLQAKVASNLVPLVRGYLQEKLPEYMVPAAFVLLETLPLMPNGKVNRQALLLQDRARPDVEETFVAPRTFVEKTLARIWAKVLQLEKVGINDNFFNLGGHSLLATQVVSQIRESFRVELPIHTLFERPTVADLAIAVIQCRAKQTSYGDSINQLPLIIPNQEQRYLPFPLTDLQQAYWIGQSNFFDLGNVAAHTYQELEYVGLDLERFNLALQRLIDRHEMLRSIVQPNGQLQILQHVPPYQIEVLDLRGQDPQVVASQLEVTRQRMSHQGPKPDLWPLFEVRVHHLENQRFRLHFSISLLISDAKSMRILSRDFIQIYRNPDACCPPIELSFRDYVLALKTLENSEVYRRSLNYWSNRLLTLPQAPKLPLIQNPSSLTNPCFVRQSARLDRETWRRLKNRAMQANLTTNVVLCTAYAEVLARWSESSHFTINVLFFNRLPLHPQVNDIVGNFSSTILLEVDNSAQNNFEARAEQLQKQLWNDLEHSYVTGILVLRELRRSLPGTSHAVMPVVFTSTLNLSLQDEENNLIVDEDTLPKVNQVYSYIQTPQVWLEQQVFEESGALVFNWDAVEELFPPGLLEDMFQAYCKLLQALAVEEDTWQKTTQQLIPSQQLEQRLAINATETPMPEELLQTLFAAQVFSQPLQTAVVSATRTLTYQELHRYSLQVGHQLRLLGACPNTLVAVVMEKGWEQVIAVLGILYSGSAYLPIDPELPKERLWHLLSHGKVQLVLTQSWLNENLEWPEQVQRLCVDNKDLNDDCGEQPLEPLQKAEDLAYVIYTSGSTGLPKGVMIDHASAINTIVDINRRFHVKPGDRVLALSSLNFDLSVYDIFGTLAAGGTIVMPDALAKRDPASWVNLIIREKVTIWNSVPALMQMLLEYVSDRPETFPSLRLVLLSGDKIPLTLPDQVKALVPGVQVISLGGATEASIWSIFYPIEAVEPAWKSIPYGRPLANQRFHVLNKALEHCPVWVPGQLYISGNGLAKGYWRDSEKTFASFIKHPQTNERLYRTGDLGRYLPNGNIEFLGREDFQVKVQGYRIELGEIEATLVLHPAVRAALVIAVDDSQALKHLVAYVILEQEQPSTMNQLRSFLGEKLPSYMVPSTFISLDTLPLTPNGKVDRNSLPSPEEVLPKQQKDFVAPRNTLELQLAQIWEKLLEIRPIGVTDNFFELGGHSFLVMRLMIEIQKQFKQELPLSTIFQGATIENLAKVLHLQNSSLPRSSLIEIQPNGSNKPFFCVHPASGTILCYAELAYYLGQEQPFYALEAVGLEKEQEPYTQVEDMAAHYIKALYAVQPRGPYLLGGWSLGGVVAFEMAQQLQKQGHEVDLLVLLDSLAPVSQQAMDDSMLLTLFLKDLGGISNKNIPVSYNHLHLLKPDEQLDYVLEQARMVNLVPPGAGLVQLRRLLQVFKSNMRSLQSYTPQPYANRIILFRATEGFSQNTGDPTLGWGKFTTQPIEVHTIPGNHYTMLTKPHVQDLAGQLSTYIKAG